MEAGRQACLPVCHTCTTVTATVGGVGGNLPAGFQEADIALGTVRQRKEEEGGRNAPCPSGRRRGVTCIWHFSEKAEMGVCLPAVLPVVYLHLAGAVPLPWGKGNLSYSLPLPTPPLLHPYPRPIPHPLPPSLILLTFSLTMPLSPEPHAPFYLLLLPPFLYLPFPLPHTVYTAISPHLSISFPTPGFYMGGGGHMGRWDIVEHLPCQHCICVVHTAL